MMLFLSGALFLNGASYFVHFGGHFMHITSVIFSPSSFKRKFSKPSLAATKNIENTTGQWDEMLICLHE